MRRCIQFYIYAHSHIGKYNSHAQQSLEHSKLVSSGTLTGSNFPVVIRIDLSIFLFTHVYIYISIHPFKNILYTHTRNIHIIYIYICLYISCWAGLFLFMSLAQRPWCKQSVSLTKRVTFPSIKPLVLGRGLELETRAWPSCPICWECTLTGALCQSSVLRLQFQCRKLPCRLSKHGSWGTVLSEVFSLVKSPKRSLSRLLASFLQIRGMRYWRMEKSAWCVRMIIFMHWGSPAVGALLTQIFERKLQSVARSWLHQMPLPLLFVFLHLGLDIIYTWLPYIYIYIYAHMCKYSRRIHIQKIYIFFLTDR